MTFHTDWFSNNIIVWKKLLKRFKNKPNLLFLEIGCYEGRATLWLLENVLIHSSAKIMVVDTFEGSMEHTKKMVRNLFLNFKENTAAYKSKLIIHKGLSGEILRTFGYKNIFDFIYIDGSHIARDVLEDVLLSFRLLKKGGVMIFDDYGKVDKDRDPLFHPDLAINAFLRIFQGQYKILNMDYQIAIQKREAVPIQKVIVQGNELKKLFFGYDELYQLQLIENKKLLTENKKLHYESERLQEDLSKLSNDLRKIHSAKVYRSWQKFCSLRRKMKLLFGVKTV